MLRFSCVDGFYSGRKTAPFWRSCNPRHKRNSKVTRYTFAGYHAHSSGHPYAQFQRIHALGVTKDTVSHYLAQSALRHHLGSRKNVPRRISSFTECTKSFTSLVRNEFSSIPWNFSARSCWGQKLFRVVCAEVISKAADAFCSTASCSLPSEQPASFH